VDDVLRIAGFVVVAASSERVLDISAPVVVGIVKFLMKHPLYPL
jgi:hypothetical protein